MKIKYILLTVLLIAIASCSDVVKYNDGYDDLSGSDGPPTISKITFSEDIETEIDQAALTDMISIWGNNLTGITSIMLNDVEVNLSTVYAVRNRITLPVPRVLPMEIDNKLKIVTELGSIDIPFVVNTPDLVINGFYNEFAVDGDTVAVTGKFIDLFDITPELATLKLNGKEVEMIEGSETSFSIQIPVGTPANSMLEIESPKLTTKLNIPFREVGYIVLDNHDPKGVNGAWEAIEGTLITGEGKDEPDPIFGVTQFFRWKGTYAQYEWVNVTYARFDMTDEDIINNPQNYSFKFEINNGEKSPLRQLIRVGRNHDGGKNYEWNPSKFNDGLTLNTHGNWKTLTFDLLDMFKSDDDSEAGVKTNLQLPKNAPDRNHFIIVYNPLQEGDADISVSNFRIVKKAQ